MQPLKRAGRLAALAILCLSAPAQQGAASSQVVTAGSLIIRQPWIRATPGGAQVAGGYLTIVNNGPTADRLSGGSLEAARSFAVHEMTAEGNVMTMRPTGPLDIPPGATVVLSPSGKHIMFSGLSHGLKKGEQVAGTLVFAHAGTVAVRFTVAGIGARSPDDTVAPGKPAPMSPGMKMD